MISRPDLRSRPTSLESGLTLEPHLSVGIGWNRLSPRGVMITSTSYSVLYGISLSWVACAAALSPPPPGALSPLLPSSSVGHGPYTPPRLELLGRIVLRRLTTSTSKNY